MEKLLDIVKCDKCNLMVETIEELTSHIITKHLSFHCEECKYRTDDANILNRHEKVEHEDCYT